MVRVVHADNIYEIYVQISDPEIKFVTESHVLKKHNKNACRLPNKKATAACPKQRKLLLSVFLAIPDPSWTQFYIKHIHVYMKTGEHRTHPIKCL